MKRGLLEWRMTGSGRIRSGWRIVMGRLVGFPLAGGSSTFRGSFFDRLQKDHAGQSGKHAEDDLQVPGSAG
jgi:hypothetical protein